MDTVQKFLRILAKNHKTDLLVTKTLISFFFEVAILRNEPNIDVEFGAQLRQTRRFVLSTILEVQVDSSNVVIVKAFFHRINAESDLIRLESDGCVRIVRQFLASEFTDIVSSTLTNIITLWENRRGVDLLRNCSHQSVVDELSRIITNWKSVKVRCLALKVASGIQL